MSNEIEAAETSLACQFGQCDDCPEIPADPFAICGCACICHPVTRARAQLAAAGGWPGGPPVCTECRQTVTEDPSGLCGWCLEAAAWREPGSITEPQRKQLAALLLAREPVASWESMVAFISGVTGEPFPVTATLQVLSRNQAGDLLEALEAEQRAPRAAGGRRGVDYRGKRNTGDKARRASQGAHRG